MPQQEFAQSMPRAQQVRPDIFATPQQVADGFLLLRRHVNGGQRAGAVQHGKLAGISPIRFDAVTGAARDERRRDDVARNVCGGHRALQLEAARTGLVTAADAPDLPLQPCHEPEDRRTIRRQRMQGRRALSGQKHCRHRRGGVLIEGNQRSRLHGDRPPLYAALR
ncbi:MAG TPA: hypothetical protein VFO21_07560 [Vicinamibacterales bacterium]|nr:hypothetical protein [Vicinamibacterales bacterium]